MFAVITLISSLALAPLHGDGVADDTAAIQQRLDAGGIVYLPMPAKHYLISRTLKIGSDTELRLDRFSCIRLAPNSNCPMIQNKSYLEGHDRRVAIVGGIWDMANRDQTENGMAWWASHPPKKDPTPKTYDPDYFFGAAMRFANLEYVTIADVTIRNPTTYGMKFCKMSYFNIHDITFDYVTWNPIRLNMDGIHLDGNCHYGRIANLFGTCYDDMVALNANDGSCAQKEGPITDVDIDGLYCDYCHSGVRLLSTGAELKRVTIRNIHGNFYTYAVGLTHYFPERGRGTMDDILIENVFMSKVLSPPDVSTVPGNVYSRTNYPPIYVQGPLDIGNLTVRNFMRDEKTVGVASIRVDTPARIDRLTVRDCRQANLTDKPIRFYDFKGKVDTLTEENNRFIGDWKDTSR